MKTSSKIITVVLLTPPLVLAYMGTFGMQIGNIQLACALMLLLFGFYTSSTHSQTHSNKIKIILKRHLTLSWVSFIICT